MLHKEIPISRAPLLDFRGRCRVWELRRRCTTKRMLHIISKRGSHNRRDANRLTCKAKSSKCLSHAQQTLNMQKLPTFPGVSSRGCF